MLYEVITTLREGSPEPAAHRGMRGVNLFLTWFLYSMNLPSFASKHRARRTFSFTGKAEKNREMIGFTGISTGTRPEKRVFRSEKGFIPQFTPGVV